MRLAEDVPSISQQFKRVEQVGWQAVSVVFAKRLFRVIRIESELTNGDNLVQQFQNTCLPMTPWYGEPSRSVFLNRSASSRSLCASCLHIGLGLVCQTISGSLHVSSILLRSLKRPSSVSPIQSTSETTHDTISEVYLVEQDEFCRLYPKGVHIFSFALVLPASTAPFTDCEYGTVSHRIVAIAKGDGFSNSNVETSVPIFLVINPAP